MEYGLSIFASTASLTSSGTATATPIPFDTQGYFPRHIRVSTTADCYVACGDIGVTAVAGDMLLQAGDAQLLHVSDCKAISILSVSGSATVTVAAMELGNWSTDQRTLDYDFTTLSAVPSPVTFTRGSGGGYFGSDGLYKWQGYNLLLRSNELTTSPWSVAPNIALVAVSDYWDCTLSGSNNGVYQSVTCTASTAYTLSFEVKLGTLAAANFKFAVYNDTGAAFIASDIVPTQTPTTADFVRVSYTFTTPVGCLSVRPYLFRNTGATTGTFSLRKAQLEAGSTASQYSPTTTAANSAPRLDYDPATLLPRGLLVEEQRVNLIPNSNGFNNNGALSAATFAQNAVDPAGTSTAWTITESATSANQYGIATNNGSATLTAAVHTATAFVKAGTNTRCQLCVSSSLSTDYANFLLTGSGSVTAATTLANCSIIALAGGWYRVSMVFTSLAATGSVVVGHINTATDTRIPLYLGTSRTLIVYGCQIELGSFPTSYIPTTTASATRSADSALMNNTNFSSWYNQTQGTFVVEYDYFGNLPAGGFNKVLLTCLPAGGNNRYELRGVIAAGSTAHQAIGTGAAVANLVSPKTIVANTVTKVASSFGASGTAITSDGLTPVTNATASAVSGHTSIDIGGGAASTQLLNGHIRRLQFYPVALPSATLQALTS